MRAGAQLRLQKRRALLMETLKQQILAKDPGASLRARQLGRAANPLLLDLAKNPDADVRRITLYCLKETGSPESAKQFLASLGDEDVQVAGVAVDGLNKMVDPSFAPQFLLAYDKAGDGFIRGEIALLLGRADKAADPKELLKRQAAEQDPQAQEGLLVALAHLGDKPAQQEFIRRLQSSKERNLRRFLGHSLAISQAWVIKPHLPLLDAKDLLVHYGVDSRPELDINLRTCDVVVTLVAKLSGKKFSFPVDDAARYTEVQVDEVRKFLKGLP
jgi:HEAT repeat protein